MALVKVKMGTKIVDGFYDCLRKTFLLARLAGAFPVTGLLDTNSKRTRCTWISPYTLYYILTTTSVAGATIVHLYDVITNSRQFKGLSTMALQCSAAIAIPCLLRLSINWRNMLNKIEQFERLLPPFKNGHLIVKNINRIILYMTLLCLLEHVIYLIYSVSVLKFCLHKENIEVSMENYFQIYFGWLLDKVSFNYNTALWIQFIATQTSLIFSYIDILVVAVTLYLVYRFRNFNRLMKLAQKKCNQNTKWCHIQAHYTRLMQLVKTVDDHINPIVFLSFLSNMALFCKMIYDFIQNQKAFSHNADSSNCVAAYSSNFISVLYKFVTISLMLIKVMTVIFLTSHLNCLSREPLKALHTLPSSGYNLEFQRLMDQVYYSNVSLSGLQIFYVKRGIILSMLSTIITYELVWLQLPTIHKE